MTVFSLYVLGIVMAILTGLMLKFTLLRGEASPFVMELPVYHVPHLKSLLLQTGSAWKGFVIRAGKVIIVVSIFLSAMNSFSLDGRTVDKIDESALASISRVFTPLLGADWRAWRSLASHGRAVYWRDGKRSGGRYAEYALYRRKYSGSGV